LPRRLAGSDQRLLTISNPLLGEPIVEVAHEQLLQSWPTLKGWLEEAGRKVSRPGSQSDLPDAAPADFVVGSEFYYLLKKEGVSAKTPVSYWNCSEWAGEVQAL
jgi:hypothetical protein